MKPAQPSRVAVYHRAAEDIEKKYHCGCCAAIYNQRHGKAELGVFEDWFKPVDADSDDYWMGECKCFSEKNIPVRVLALCFMAAMVEAGDA